MTNNTDLQRLFVYCIFFEAKDKIQPSLSIKRQCYSNVNFLTSLTSYAFFRFDLTFRELGHKKV